MEQRYQLLRDLHLSGMEKKREAQTVVDERHLIARKLSKITEEEHAPPQSTDQPAAASPTYKTPPQVAVGADFVGQNRLHTPVSVSL